MERVTNDRQFLAALVLRQTVVGFRQEPANRTRAQQPDIQIVHRVLDGLVRLDYTCTKLRPHGWRGTKPLIGLGIFEPKQVLVFDQNLT